MFINGACCGMASHESTKKSIRKTERQTVVNINRISRIRTFIKKVDNAVSAKLNKTDILASFIKAQKEIMKGVNKRVMHKNTASRTVSRLHRSVKIAIGEHLSQ
jgi:small subunit ribosomal protein S20